MYLIDICYCPTNYWSRTSTHRILLYYQAVHRIELKYTFTYNLINNYLCPTNYLSRTSTHCILLYYEVVHWIELKDTFTFNKILSRTTCIQPTTDPENEIYFFVFPDEAECNEFHCVMERCVSHLEVMNTEVTPLEGKILTYFLAMISHYSVSASTRFWTCGDFVPQVP